VDQLGKMAVSQESAAHQQPPEHEQEPATTPPVDLPAETVEETPTLKTLEEMMSMSIEELAKELLRAQGKISDLEIYTSELDGVTDSLQQQLEEAREENVGDPAKDKMIDALQAEIERMEQEMGGQESADNDSAINYDALDKLDDELAFAKEQCLIKDAEIARLKTLEEGARRDGDGAAQWRESAIQAQADHRAVKQEYDSKVTIIYACKARRKGVAFCFKKKYPCTKWIISSEKITQVPLRGEQPTGSLPLRSSH